MASQYFSQEGLEKLKSEHEYRLNVLRVEIAKRLKEAKEQGDLSENAEYSEAKEAQALNEGRIEDIKVILETAVIIKENHKGGIITVGCTVVVDSKNGKKTYTIVGAAESNPTEGKISNESPMGSAFLGKKKGDSVQVKTPKGAVDYKILEVK
jgi:transcription elongation factor GreA